MEEAAPPKSPPLAGAAAPALAVAGAFCPKRPPLLGVEEAPKRPVPDDELGAAPADCVPKMLPAFGGSAVLCPPNRPPPPVPAAPNVGVFEPEPALLDVFPNKELPPCGAVDGVPLLDAPDVNENILGGG